MLLILIQWHLKTKYSVWRTRRIISAQFIPENIHLRPYNDLFNMEERCTEKNTHFCILQGQPISSSLLPHPFPYLQTYGLKLITIASICCNMLHFSSKPLKRMMFTSIRTRFFFPYNSQETWSEINNYQIRCMIGLCGFKRWLFRGSNISSSCVHSCFGNSEEDGVYPHWKLGST